VAAADVDSCHLARGRCCEKSASWITQSRQLSARAQVVAFFTPHTLLASQSTKHRSHTKTVERARDCCDKPSFGRGNVAENARPDRLLLFSALKKIQCVDRAEKNNLVSGETWWEPTWQNFA